MLEVINPLQTTYLDPGIVSAESSLCATIHWGYTCVFWFVRMPPHPLCNNFNWKVVAHVCLQTLSAKVCEMFVFEIKIKKKQNIVAAACTFQSYYERNTSFRYLVHAASWKANSAKLPSVGWRLNASKSESMLAKPRCPPPPTLQDKH